MYSPRRLLLGQVLLALAASLTAVTGTPIITEFMADNKKTLSDEDGAFPDWVEIYNPDAASVNLLGWHLTDSAADLIKWTFPAVTLDSGQFMIVYASGKNRVNPAGRLHTNFTLTASGEYLALVAPDGVTKATEFPFPFPPQRPDISYGFAFGVANMVSKGATAQYLVPSSSTLGDTWLAPGFTPTGWSSGPLGLGFGLLVPGLTVTEVRSTATNITMNLAEADSLLQGNGASLVNTQIRPVLNFLGDGAEGHYGTNNAFAITGNYRVSGATGQLVIPAAGTYTFGINTDDGGRIRIDLNRDGDFLDAGEAVVVDDANHGPTDKLGTVTFTAAGNYPVEVTYFNSLGGSDLEFFAVAGTKTSWDATFKLVGDTAGGGLSVLTLPDGVVGGNGQDIATNVQSVMKGINPTLYALIPFTLNPGTQLDTISLNMSYNDGFVAYLNGTEVVRRNAPASLTWQSNATASRTNVASLSPEAINLSSFRNLLASGPNVLAIQGLNVTAADASFLVLPQLTGGGLTGTTQAYYFNQPTPRTINSTPASLGFVADTQFSVKRGIYETAFTLNVTSATPGSTIVYTTDGTPPTLTHGTVVLPTSPVATGLAAILINKTTALRAIAFKADYTTTGVDTQTYLFPATTLAQPLDPVGWPLHGTAINGQVLDYAMDQTIVSNLNPSIGGTAAVKSSLLALPSVCLTLPVASMMDPTTGFYVNARQDGFDWEREGSIEMLNDPNTVDHGFHAHCGIRVRGGYSRDASNPKHGFRIFFRSEYGDGKLNYPLYGGQDKAAEVFDKFDLNCSQNYSWSFGGDGQNVFMRDQICNDMQLDMGDLSQHNRYVHLYINGLYWGVYGFQERPEAAFASSYLGGSNTDYDVIKSEAGPYTVNPTDGDLNAWQDLWNKSRACYFINKDQNPGGTPHTYSQTEKNTAYFKMMGRAADGITPTNDPILLDDGKLINYMMVIFFSGNTDAPLSAFLGNNNPNNFYALRDRRGGHGFFFVAHDSEHSFEAGAAAVDRTGPFNDPVSGSWNNFTVSNPQFTHQDVMLNKEYQMRFADRAYKHLIDPKGALSLAKNQGRVTKRGAELEAAMIAESARWGDSKTSPAKNVQDWRNTKTALFNYFTNRNAVLIDQLKGDNLYPAINPPTLTPLGGTYPGPLTVLIDSADTVASLFTLDGPDPRIIGGAINPAAKLSAFNLSIISSGDEWKFMDDGSNQGTAWKETNFPEVAWTQLVGGVLKVKSGPSRLGYGEIGPISTSSTVSYVDTDPMKPGIQRNLTTYFRRTFQIPTLTNVRSVSLEVARDDGCVVYLNGRELGRSNLPVAPAVISYTTPALANVGSTDANTWQTIPVQLSDLQAGTNLMAVEVHQFSPDSVDMGFNLRLRVVQATPNAPSNLGPGLHTVRSRTLDANGNWSALNEQIYLVDGEAASSANLIIKELMYNPLNPNAQEIAAGFTSDSAFQWIELKNVGQKIIDLRGAYFTSGLTFTFPDLGPVQTLAPGEHTLLVGDLAGFQARYGHGQDAHIAGVFKGSLAKGGEQILLKAVDGTVILDFTYSDLAPWPTAADGDSYSLVFSGATMGPPGANAAGSNPLNWHSSATPGGTPGFEEIPTSYAAWKTIHTVTDVVPDPDRDGIPNLLEYAAGTDPNVPNELPIITPSLASYTLPVPQISGSYFTISHERNLAADDILWAIETSPSMTATTWQSVQAVLVGETNHHDGTATMTYRAPLPFPVGPGPRWFVRARATLK